MGTHHRTKRKGRRLLASFVALLIAVAVSAVTLLVSGGASPAGAATSCTPKASYSINAAAHVLTVSSAGNKRLCNNVRFGVGVMAYTNPNAVQSNLPSTLPQTRAWSHQWVYGGGKPMAVRYLTVCGSQVDFYSSNGPVITFPNRITRYGKGNGEWPHPIQTYLTGTQHPWVIYPPKNCVPAPTVSSTCPGDCKGIALETTTLHAARWATRLNVYLDSKLVNSYTLAATKSLAVAHHVADGHKVTVTAQVVGQKAVQKWVFVVHCPPLPQVKLISQICYCPGQANALAWSITNTTPYAQGMTVYDTYRGVTKVALVRQGSKLVSATLRVPAHKSGTLKGVWLTPGHTISVVLAVQNVNPKAPWRTQASPLKISA